MAPAASGVLRGGSNRFCVQVRCATAAVKYLIRIIMYFFDYKMSRLRSGECRAASCLEESSLMSRKPVALTLWASTTERLAAICSEPCGSPRRIASDPVSVPMRRAVQAAGLARPAVPRTCWSAGRISVRFRNYWEQGCGDDDDLHPCSEQGRAWALSPPDM